MKYSLLDLMVLTGIVAVYFGLHYSQPLLPVFAWPQIIALLTSVGIVLPAKRRNVAVLPVTAGAIGALLSSVALSIEVIMSLTHNGYWVWGPDSLIVLVIIAAETACGALLGATVRFVMRRIGVLPPAAQS